MVNSLPLLLGIFLGKDSLSYMYVACNSMALVQLFEVLLKLLVIMDV